MRKLELVAAAAMLTVASPVMAQGRGHGRDDRGARVPPGQLPPAGMCRVWIDGVPPGRQPAPTDCATAYMTRPYNGRIIYGSGNSAFPGRGQGRWQQQRQGGYGQVSRDDRGGDRDRDYDRGRDRDRDRDYDRDRDGDRDRRYGGDRGQQWPSSQQWPNTQQRRTHARQDGDDDRGDGRYQQQHEQGDRNHGHGARGSGDRSSQGGPNQGGDWHRTHP